jgi:GTP-dependent phosphoenolpyruvate carboxykinase
VQGILEVEPSDWTGDLTDQRAFFDKIGDHLPKELREEQNAFAKRLGR